MVGVVCSNIRHCLVKTFQTFVTDDVFYTTEKNKQHTYNNSWADYPNKFYTKYSMTLQV